MNASAAETRSEREAELSRLRWRCRRGMLELDLMLQPFLEGPFQSLTEPQRQAFFQLLDFQDQELLEVLMLQTETEDSSLNDIIAKIRSSV